MSEAPPTIDADLGDGANTFDLTATSVGKNARVTANITG